ncbi:type II toxin-antitoxin system VapC family toxin [Methylotuvimicrobium sp. KM2]|uniref:type II toxin-antitoxin system tRNA(fMet)-specific endonuclease VapC n=1 Tax=Methylotuvimicrobium sp. KM2 TaxID=3133976 RepID=UPI0031019A32
MKYLLDTNVCIRYMQGRVTAIRDAIHARRSESMSICSVVRAELFYGAMKSQFPSETLDKQRRFLDCFPTLPFDDRSALIFGQIRADLHRQGMPIGPYDLQIAAIALANNLTLVTHNTREFSRIAGLQLTDWEI